MTWRGRILVNPARIRAVNLERGGDGGEYILADRALELLRNVAASLGRPRASRAWNLVGPYGAGKSAFAAFLVRLLGPGGGRLGALQTCAGRDPELADSFRAILGETRGFCPVLVTGAPEPLPGRFLARLAVAADFFFAGCEKENPVARSVFRAPAGESFGAAVRAMDAVNRAVVRAGGAGTLVVVDELGKFLEHEAAVPGANSAYFMQALAEHAAEAGAGRAAVFGLLHQGFDRYARGLGPDARREWEKVRGRFDEAAFAESPGQMTRIIARAIVRNLGADDEKKIRAAVAAPAEAVWKSGVLRGAGRRDAGETLAACYPLHPVAAALLPLLSQKLGQSERTMFSYLGGGQSRGFSEAVAGLRAPGDFVMPHHLYDYFVADRLNCGIIEREEKNSPRETTPRENIPMPEALPEALPQTYETCPKCGHVSGDLALAIENAEADLLASGNEFDRLCQVLRYDTDIAERRDAAEQMQEPAEAVLRLLDTLKPLWELRDRH